jgi:ATP-binding cassette subfamily F protein 3
MDIKKRESNGEKLEAKKDKKVKVQTINKTQLKVLNDKLKKFEKKLANLQKRNKDLEAMLADPSCYENKEKLAQTVQKHEKLKAEMESVEAQWLETQEALEN